MEDVEPAETIDRGIDHRFDGCRVGCVELHGKRGIAQRFRSRSCAILEQVGDDDPAALIHYPAGDGRTDAAAAASDNGDLAFEPAHPVILP